MSSVSHSAPLQKYRRGKAKEEKKDPTFKMSSLSCSSEGKRKFTLYTQNGCVINSPYTTSVNKDGLIVNSRSYMPKKYYDFSNLPEYNTTEPGCCTAVFKGSTITSITSCGPMSLPVPVECKPNFVLLTDSEDIFLVLVGNNVDRKYNCLIVRGTIDTATCCFLRHIKKELGNQIPILALVDYDPMSLKLLSFYETWKSEKMPLELASVDLDIKWLGLRHIHLDVADNDNALEPEQLKKLEFTIMDEDDLAAAKELLFNAKFVKKSPERVAEVRRMIDKKLMIRVAHLDTIDFLLKYLPTVIEGKKWI